MILKPKKKEKLVQSDGIAALATGIDALGGGAPIFSIVQSIIKQVGSVQSNHLVSKVNGLLEELSAADPVLLGQTVNNLKDEFGEDYFNEALFNAIEKSDSTIRTRMIGRLLTLSSKDEKAKSNFWEILEVLKTLFMADLENVSILAEYNESAFQSSKGGGGGVFNPKISPSSERRYRAAGIYVDDMQGEQKEVYELCKLVILCVH